MNKCLHHAFLLTFDVEEFTVPVERTAVSKEERDTLFALGQEGVKKLAALLKRQQVPATIFCTYDFFCRYSGEIQELQNKGCEIALHAYAHADDYRTMDESMVFSRLSAAKKAMEKKLQSPLDGFRGPGFRAPNVSVLKKLGFTYDSSLHPTYVPGKYNNLLRSRKIKKRDSLLEVPVSVVPFLRLPFSWIWFRNLPLLYVKLCTLLNMSSSAYTLVYFHPWEFVNLQNKYHYKDFVWKATIRNTGVSFEKKLEEYITWAKTKGTFLTIHEFIKKL
jgi:peptidoglycan/xylan/chitin deacetylase (PgdA/CDA1 family)